MMDSKFLSLSWEAYSKSICNGLGSLQQQGQFVDMTVAADGHHVKVHQLVLSLVSPFIMDLIKSANCPHPVIFLNRVSFSTLQSILEYAYSGEVMVEPDSLSSFLEACKELHIKGLEDVTITLQGDDNKEPLSEAEPIDNKNFRDLEDSLDGLDSTAALMVEEDESSSYCPPTIETDNSESEPEEKPKIRSIKTSIRRSVETCMRTRETPVRSTEETPMRTTERPTRTGTKRKRTEKIKKENMDTSEHEYSHNAELNNHYMEIEPYKAGSRWLCRDEYYYVVQRTKGPTCYLRCASEKCPVTWKLSRKSGVGPIMGTHNHLPTPWVPNRNAMFQALRKRTTTECLPLNVIYKEEADRYQDAAPHLPYDSVIPSMRKWRRGALLAFSRDQSMG